MKSLMMIGTCIVLTVMLAGCTTPPATPPASPPPSPTQTSIVSLTSPVPTETVSPGPTETVFPELTPSPTPLPSTSSIPSPIARFTASPSAGKAPLTVHFMDISTGSPTEWVWDFGDNTTSNLQNPTHTYTDPGTYTVRLRASNRGGSTTETKFYSISVNAAYAPPGASFSANPPTMAQPYTVQFLDRSTGPPTNWSWSFGDGGTSLKQNPEHTYPGPGTFIVVLDVSNPAGTGKTTGYVTIGG
jgi:PKD repeat protein